MDASVVHKVQTPAHRGLGHRLDVPAPAFNLINDLLNFFPDLETLISSIRTVHHHKQNATRELLPGDLRRPASRRSRSSKKRCASSTSTQQKRYKCYKCHTRLGAPKEFIRHMEEKCELLRVYRCPDCDKKPFHRAYHLVEHHKKQHACTQDPCTHLANAEEYEPPKSVLGCGYCVQYFDKAKDFLDHLIRHLKPLGLEPIWSDTKHIQSLLQHPRLRTTWNGLCATRFDGPACYWPPLTWNMNDVEEEVHDLQYGVSGQYLSLCLAKLLEKRLRGVHLDPMHRLAITSPCLPSFASQPITTTYSSFKAPTFPLVTGLDVQMSNDLPNTSHDPADLTNTSPSTLVNAEDLWSAEASPIGWNNIMAGTSFMMSDFKETLPMFDTTLDYTSQLLDLDSWEGKTFDETTYTNTHERQSPFTTFDAPGAQVDTVEQMVFNTIPGFYSNPPGVTEHHTTPITGFIAPMDTISSPPLEDGYIGLLTSEPFPPFNPTPPLQEQRSHKRSISGRILRKIL